jgi:putative ABC transport system ATP-binding protein
MKSSASPSAISIDALRFGYGAKPVLDISKLTIARGSHTLISGDSGCGKSTLMNLIGGVLTGFDGKIEVVGTSLAGLRASARDRFRAAHLGVIFQQFNLIPYLNVTENIELAPRLARKTVDRARIAAMMQHLQIAELASAPAANLSHGQQQRVAAARALAAGADIVLADEPTSALDDRNARLFLDLLFKEAELNRTTIVVVSHDLRYKKRFDQFIDLAQINRALKPVAKNKKGRGQ